MVRLRRARIAPTPRAPPPSSSELGLSSSRGPILRSMFSLFVTQGAGASSAKKDLGTCDKSGKKLASSEFIGPEFDVTMLSPKIPGLEAGTPYRLRIAYEALVVVEPTEGSAPLCHFKYQDILCWGHGKKTFQFKVFGNLFGQERSEYVTIRFETSHGKVRETAPTRSLPLSRPMRAPLSAPARQPVTPAQIGSARTVARGGDALNGTLANGRHGEAGGLKRRLQSARDIAARA